MMTKEELFEDFISDFSNFIRLNKDSLHNIEKDFKKNHQATVSTIKELLNIKGFASDIIKTEDIYFNSLLVNELKGDIKEKEFIKIIKDYLKFELGVEKEIQEKRKISIEEETDESENYLMSNFYEMNELFGNMVEYFAIVKNIDFAAKISEKQKSVLLIENLNSMLKELLSIEITIKCNITSIILKEINKEKINMKQAV
ncbi:MAG: hypothetical protein ACYCS0_08215 [bacterium]|jgi:hypothetical protein